MENDRRVQGLEELSEASRNSDLSTLASFYKARIRNSLPARTDERESCERQLYELPVVKGPARID
jgi:hypothetical protein